MLVSYAQNFEDVMLWRALGHVSDGFYIDIGAQDPLIDSVSLAFYERGWRGISVEPTAHYATLLRQQRPGDKVVQAAVGDEPGILPLFEIADTGLTTLDREIAAQHRERGFVVHETTAPVVTLSSLFVAAGCDDIHWLKVDVEGFEYQALNSWGDSPARPWVVVVESTLPLTQIRSHDMWEPLLLDRGYTFAYFDGLNRYYVSEAHSALLQDLATPPNVFDEFALNGTASATFHRAIEQRFKSQIGELNQRLEEQSAAAQAGLAALSASAERERAVQMELESARERQTQFKEEAAERETAARDRLDNAIAALKTQQERQAEINRAHAERERQLNEMLLAAERTARQLQQAGAQREQQLAAQSRQDLLSQLQAREFQHEQAEQKLASLWQDAWRQENDRTRQHGAALALAGAKADEREHALRLEAKEQRDALRQQLQAQLLATEQAGTALEQLRRELDQVHASLTWRVAAPWRWLRNEVARPGLKTRRALPDTDPPPILSAQARAGEEIAWLAAPQSSPLQDDSMTNELPRQGSVQHADQLLALYDEDFVRCTYLSVLRRPADPAGLATYLGQIRAGTEKEQLIAAMANSSEAQALLADRLPGLTELVSRVRRSRPNVWARALRRMSSVAIRPLYVQLEALQYQLRILSAHASVSCLQANELAKAQNQYFEKLAELVHLNTNFNPLPSNPTIGATKPNITVEDLIKIARELSRVVKS